MIIDPQITILLATYNGEHYIEQQLDSIINQSYTNWKLIVRDDGSSDKTVELVNVYCSKHNNIEIIVNNGTKRGACSNFSALFKLAKDDKKIGYLMFCDQDDIWKPEKIKQSIAAVLALEREFDLQPVLIYSDFEIMDGDGNFVPGSFKLKQQIDIRSLISYNYVLGCTVMLNRPMIEKINQIPIEAVNHDYWIALVASIYKTRFLNKKLLKYRQHNNNASLNYQGNNTLKERLRRVVFSPDKEINYLKEKLVMLNGFYTLYYSQLSPVARAVLGNYLRAFQMNRLQVCIIMMKNHIFRKGFFQTFASFYQVLFFYKRIITNNHS